MHTKTGFIETLGQPKLAKITLNNYIDKVPIVKEINKMRLDTLMNNIFQKVKRLDLSFPKAQKA